MARHLVGLHDGIICLGNPNVVGHLFPGSLFSSFTPVNGYISILPFLTTQCLAYRIIKYSREQLLNQGTV